MTRLLGSEPLDDPSGLARSEFRRRFAWEFNGMRLHELYFGNLHKRGSRLDPSSPCAKKITEDFGSLKAWENDFKSAGAMRGIGWVVLAHDKMGNKLSNLWINEHDGGNLVGAEPLLVMDVFEHAFLADYGLAKAKYIEAFFAAIDWLAVLKRFH